MFVRHFTLAQVIAHFDNIVERFGADHVATKSNGETGCVYFEQDGFVLSPVCIVGQWLADLGLLGLLSREAFGWEQANGGPTIAPLGPTCEFGGLGMWEVAGFSQYITATEAAQRFMRYVQSAQDQGKAWGKAVEGGKAAIAEWDRQRIEGLVAAERDRLVNHSEVAVALG